MTVTNREAENWNKVHQMAFRRQIEKARRESVARYVAEVKARREVLTTPKQGG